MRSRRRGWVERVILPLLLLRPFRCRPCSERHYGFFFRSRATAALGAGLKASPERAKAT